MGKKYGVKLIPKKYIYIVWCPIPNVTNRTPIKKHKCNFISYDTTYIDGYRESFGTIVGRYVRSYKPKDSRSNYFKALGMNNVMDTSDNSEGSYLAQLDDALEFPHKTHEDKDQKRTWLLKY
ncbi:hypothetical protein BD770DRAFT_179484 [Pilaira anomala]|nr:hypothetical protein BD770DRAFT_179484 [Pilaira anomala]